MNASLFSWSGLVISLLVLVALAAIIFFAARGTIRLIRRQRQKRDDTFPSGGV